MTAADKRTVRQRTHTRAGLKEGAVVGGTIGSRGVVVDSGRLKYIQTTRSAGSGRTSGGRAGAARVKL